MLYAAICMASLPGIPSSIPACITACIYFKAKAIPLEVNAEVVSSCFSCRNRHFPPSSNICFINCWYSLSVPREAIKVRLERSVMAILGTARKIGISASVKWARWEIHTPDTRDTRICVREKRRGDNTSSTFQGLMARTITSASDMACWLSVVMCIAGKCSCSLSSLSIFGLETIMSFSL